MSALTRKQKGYLAQLAGEAYMDCVGEMVEGESLAEYRHRQVGYACGKAGLRCCDQKDFNLVKAHFLQLLGRHGAAFNAHVREATNPGRVALFKVLQACKEFGFERGYAESICRRQNNGMGLEDLAVGHQEKRLWALVFTLRNRGIKKKKELTADYADSADGTLTEANKANEDRRAA